MKHEPDWALHRRTFGTLCYFAREPKNKVKKGEPKYRPAVYVGMDPKRSGWRVVWPSKESRKNGTTTTVYRVATTRQAKFTAYFVKDVDKLLEDVVTVSETLEQRLELEKFGQELGATDLQEEKAEERGFKVFLYAALLGYENCGPVATCGVLPGSAALWSRSHLGLVPGFLGD
jgi:hypothetical protein